MEGSLSLTEGAIIGEGASASSVTTTPAPNIVLNGFPASSGQGNLPCGNLQLSYFPRLSELSKGFTCAFPMIMPVHMHAALNNGQHVSVLVAVLDDVGPGEALPETAPVEVPQAKKPDRHGRRREAKGGTEKWIRREEPSTSLRSVDVRGLCTEDGSKEACRKMAVDAHAAQVYASFVKGKLGTLMQTRHGSRFVCSMIERLPYGRRAAFESDPDVIFTEVIDALPRAAMQATGKNIYLSLLTKAEQEGALPSKTTRTLVERLAKYLSVMVQCSQASQVLTEAFQVPSIRKVLEAVVVDLVGDVCKTPPGCQFLMHILEHLRSEEVAMAILESTECFQSLSWDADWSKLLVRAGNFGRLHRAQLAERVRRASLEEHQKCTQEVKLAALWK